MPTKEKYILFAASDLLAAKGGTGDTIPTLTASETEKFSV